MSRISRFVVLVTAITSLCAVMSATAGAVTWHNTGNTNFTATGGAGTLSVGSTSLRCSSSDATGVSPVTTTSNVLATGNVTFTGCQLGFFPAHVACAYTLTGISATTTTVTGLADVHCNSTVVGSSPCTISGSTAGTYTNPVSPSTTGRLHLAHSTTLTITGSGCLITGTGTLTAQTLTITSASGGTGTLGPRFSRTA